MLSDSILVRKLNAVFSACSIDTLLLPRCFISSKNMDIKSMFIAENLENSFKSAVAH